MGDSAETEKQGSMGRHFTLSFENIHLIQRN